MFKTCRRQQELNENVNLKSVHFVALYYINLLLYCVIFVTQLDGSEPVCSNNNITYFHYTAWPSACSNYMCEVYLILLTHIMERSPS